MKIFIVVHSCQEYGEQPAGYFSTKEKAQRWVRNNPQSSHQGGSEDCGEYEIVECELDKE